MYILNDGTNVTAKQIKQAVAAGSARFVHSHIDGGTATGLRLNVVNIDTRGECYSVWDEVWTTIPKSYGQALKAAYCKI